MMMRLGRELEEYIAGRLAEVEPWANTTINSGAIFGDEDGRSSHYLVQCKDTDQPTRRNFIIGEDDWGQLQRAALRERDPDGNYRVGIFVVRNCNGKVVVGLDLEDFLGMVETVNDSCGNKAVELADFLKELREECPEQWIEAALESGVIVRFMIDLVEG